MPRGASPDQRLDAALGVRGVVRGEDRADRAGGVRRASQQQDALRGARREGAGDAAREKRPGFGASLRGVHSDQVGPNPVGVGEQAAGGRAEQNVRLAGAAERLRGPRDDRPGVAVLPGGDAPHLAGSQADIDPVR